MIIRFFDLLLSISLLLLTLPITLLVYCLALFDTGSPLFFQERVGKNKVPFILVKFRTMSLNTASVASHLAETSSITKLGKTLRKTKLDELPQLLNVIKGDMSLVGPRPGLFSQLELTNARDTLDVFSVRPGITGLAQVNNIDMSTPTLLAKTDKEMIDSMSLITYFRLIALTALGKGSGDGARY